jgi:bifunctional non-homologous end joining protein LigD
MGLEGIVAKRRDKPYRSGRTADWVKIKNPNAPNATIAGFFYGSARTQRR